MELLDCQRDSYVREAEANVVDCRADGEHFVVRLDSSILFPEGGGQPSDRGAIGGVAVLDVRRTEDGVVEHVLAGPVPTGKVRVTVDWARRFDLMQQHTAQHLITAKFIELFGFQTSSFHLFDHVSDIELDIESVSAQQLAAVEEEVNRAIADARAVNYELIAPERLDEFGVRYRRLPPNHSGDLRVIHIAGIDKNPCGGTHVRNTAHLQVIKFLGTEKLSRGTRVLWLAGGRVRMRLGELLAREATIGKLLGVPAAESVARVDVVVQEKLAQSKTLERAMREIAELLGEKLAATGESFVFYQRDGGDAAFLNTLATSILRFRPGTTLFLAANETGAAHGSVLLFGEAQFVKSAQALVISKLEGRGGGPPGKFQAKCGNLSGVAELATELKALLATSSP